MTRRGVPYATYHTCLHGMTFIGFCFYFYAVACEQENILSSVVCVEGGVGGGEAGREGGEKGGRRDAA